MSKSFRTLCLNGATIEAVPLKKNKEFLTAGLEGACAGGHLELVKFLIKTGAHVSSHAFLYAYNSNHAPVVDYLLESANKSPENLFPLLLVAHGDGETILVEKILQVLKPIPSLNKLLEWASSKSELLEIVKFAVKNGAILDSILEGFSNACVNDCIDSAMYLRSQIPARDKKTIMSNALIRTCVSEAPNVFKWLYDNLNNHIINIGNIINMLCKHKQKEAFFYAICKEKKNNRVWSNYIKIDTHPNFLFFILKEDRKRQKRDWTFWHHHSSNILIQRMLEIGINRHIMSSNIDLFVKEHTDLFRSTLYGEDKDKTKNMMIQLHKQLVHWRLNYRVYAMVAPFVCKDVVGFVSRFAGFYIPDYM